MLNSTPPQMDDGAKAWGDYLISRIGEGTLPPGTPIHLWWKEHQLWRSAGWTWDMEVLLLSACKMQKMPSKGLCLHLHHLVLKVYQSGSIDSKETNICTLHCWLADQPVMNWAIFNVCACILYWYWWVCVPAIIMEITVHAGAWLNSSTSRLRDVGYKKENE